MIFMILGFIIILLLILALVIKEHRRNLLIGAGGALILAVLVGGYYLKTFNNLVTLDETVNTQWSQVENQMQRRYDLIPNLVNTVKGYAKHEKEVFLNIAESRSKLAGAKTPRAKMEASRGLEGALSRLLMVVENYPDLKANQNFTRLMDELAGTENRMAVERRRYNEMVKVYNITIRRYPTAMIAKNMGFEKKQAFQAEDKVKFAPKVDFN